MKSQTKIMLFLICFAAIAGYKIGEMRANRTISIETTNISPDCWTYNSQTRVLTLIFGHRTIGNSTTVDLGQRPDSRPLEYNFGPGSLYHLNP